MKKTSTKTKAKPKPRAKPKQARLTSKQEAFCIAYLKIGNASEAYRQCYSTKNMKPETVNRAAKELLDNPKIAARLKELNQAAVTDAVMTRQEALERLSLFARTDLADLVEFSTYEPGEDDEGRPVIQSAWRIKDSALQNPEKLSAIAELTAGRDGIKIKAHSPLSAIQQLAKMQGWESAAKHEITGKNGGPIRSQIDAVDAKLAEGLAAKLVG